MSIYPLIPGLPLAAFLALALGGRRLGEAAHRISAPAIAASFLLSVAALVEVVRSGAVQVAPYSLIDVGDFTVEAGMYLDQLAVLLLVLVTGVSFAVQVYSSRYMTGDPRYRRFFAVMALFTAAMTLLVTSDNLLVTYMCWELMGICSYLLISHWAVRRPGGRAATKAFLVNAVADVGLGFGVILAFSTYGTLEIREILAQAAGASGQTLGLLGFEIERNTLIALCLLSGAMGKSAQVPMHVWLPHAMEAPTPVSALIHAATMVNAGPFLLVRFAPLLLLAPAAMVAIAVVGAVTALYGALVSLTQSDVKKMLAYSTISQIGFMVFACGVGAFVAAIFHLLAHGFLKGYLFLSTGTALESAGHHSHGSREIAPGRLGPLALGALALACIPPFLLFSGPYERLWSAPQLPSAQAAFWAVALATVFVTALYTFRGVVSLFGSGVGSPAAVQPRLLSRAHLPSLVLLGVGAGAVLLTLWSWLGTFLGPGLGNWSPADVPTAFSPWLAIPLAAALAGWGWAYYRHVRPLAAPLVERGWAKTAYVHLLNRLYFDELHEACAVRPTLRFSDWLWRRVDLRWIDRPVLGVATAGRSVSGWIGRIVEQGLVERAVRAAQHGMLRLSGWLSDAIDLRATSALLRGLGRCVEFAGAGLQRVEPRTLRHHLLTAVCWLVLAIGLSYWLAA